MHLPADPYAADAPLPRVARVTSRPRSLWSLVRAERIDLPSGGFALVCWETMTRDRGPYRLTWGTEVAVSVLDEPSAYYGGWRGVARQLGHTLSMCITDPPADRHGLITLYAAIGRVLDTLGADATPLDIARAARADLAQWAAFMAEPADEAL